MSAASDVPEVLAVALRDRGLGDLWTALDERDRLRYARWVTKAHGATAKRRARTVGDRIADGRGWRGPVRRVLENLFGIPQGTTAADIDTGAARWPPSGDWLAREAKAKVGGVTRCPLRP